MNKILVIVYVPILETKYDIYIPINKKIGTIKNSIIDSIEELNYDKNIRKLKLYDKDSSMLYNNNIFVKESGIVNGTKLILM